MVTTSWENKATEFRNDLAAIAATPEQFAQTSGDFLISESTLNNMNYMIQSQAIMLSTNQILTICGYIFIFAALAICLAPKPKKKVAIGVGH